MDKEELRNVDGSDSLHPNRSGDVVVVTRPPYQADAGTNGQVIALSHFFGQHGYLPNTVDLANNINMHGTFVMAGPGVNHLSGVKDLRAVDMAPTMALLMGIPGPMNARGAILYDILQNSDKLHEVTILDISDYHGQLTPLTDTADTVSDRPANPSFNIGGAAFLKSWFDTYAAEAPERRRRAAGHHHGRRRLHRCDPTDLELLRRQADDRDHEHDGRRHRRARQPQLRLRRRLLPPAAGTAVEPSVRVVEHRRREWQHACEWKKSQTFNFPDGVEVSIVGFSNDDIPSLTRPGALDPFHVANSLTRPMLRRRTSTRRPMPSSRSATSAPPMAP